MPAHMTVVRELLPPHADHPRTFRDNQFVYPVISRRSGGVSLGINLSPDQGCNFHCVYCQVDRLQDPPMRFVAVDRLLEELERTYDFVTSGQWLSDRSEIEVPASQRVLRDIAFSGDGEPTSYRNFDTIVAAVADFKRQRGISGVRIVLITNSSLLHRPHVQRALAIMDVNQGSVWAKLDAGTTEAYREINRSTVPYDLILRNLLDTARLRPIVIQTMFFTQLGNGPSSEEVEAYIGRLRDLVEAGGRIDRVQVYTVARRPVVSTVEPLPFEVLEAIAERIANGADVAVEVFAGQPGASLPAG